MFTVQKYFGMGGWQNEKSFDALEEAIRFCQYHDNLRAGRVVSDGKVVWNDDDVPAPRRVGVCDQEGHFLGTQSE